MRRLQPLRRSYLQRACVKSRSTAQCVRGHGSKLPTHEFSHGSWQWKAEARYLGTRTLIPYTPSRFRTSEPQISIHLQLLQTAISGQTTAKFQIRGYQELQASRVARQATVRNSAKHSCHQNARVLLELSGHKVENVRDLLCNETRAF